ncbi:MAG: acyl-CoA dehydrogenase [Rhodospirillaceae bacterium]|nr:acyl-CoA dehydrogenase [Rhodospirillaceae bacterium]
MRPACPEPAQSLTEMVRSWPPDQLVRDGIGLLQAGLDFADPGDLPALLALLTRLHTAGRHDLALGRLFEGHIDALQIVARYGDRPLIQGAHGAARGAARFGVWNADLPGDPLRLSDGRLYGGKAFASGAGCLTHALVTVDAGDRDRVQLILVDLVRHPPDVDKGWWRTLGMQRSETHVVRWSGAPIGQSALVGKPGDYEREPWFSGGALRFVAVHAGGIAAIFDHVRNHLVDKGRADDPHQASRLGTLFGLADLAAAVCRRTAERWFEEPDHMRPTRVASTRMAVADLAEQAMTLAQQSVGVQALFQDHPLCRTLADLMVYLRQPAPDGHRVRAGQAAAAGTLGVVL